MSPMIEKAISIAIILFILSMVSERFVTWVKLYFGRDGRWLMGFSKKGEDLTTKKKDPEQEKQRERKILGLNISLSIMVALVAHADFFQMFGEEAPYKAIGWIDLARSSITPANIISGFFGCVLTGLFISLGSKFWHDLLDLLFYTKNLKEKLTNPQTFQVTSVDQLNEFLQFNEGDLVRMAIAQNEIPLKSKFPNIDYLNDSVGIVHGERRAVMSIYLHDENAAGIPAQVPVKLPSGSTFQVHTEVVPDAGVATISAGMDGSLAGKTSKGFQGSGCCVVKDKDENHFILTNCHVFTEGDLESPQHDTGQTKALYNGKEIGKWEFGSLDSRGDFALVSLDKPDQFIASENVEIFNNRLREIKKDDQLTLKVTLRGFNVKTNSNAFVLDVVENKQAILYNFGRKVVFDRVILIGNKPDKLTCRPASDHGDSGGAVFDDQNNLIGIIAGKNKRFSLVLPVQKFIIDQKLQIV
jgi:hypothetical protein